MFLFVWWNRPLSNLPSSQTWKILLVFSSQPSENKNAFYLNFVLLLILIEHLPRAGGNSSNTTESYCKTNPTGSRNYSWTEIVIIEQFKTNIYIRFFLFSILIQGKLSHISPVRKEQILKRWKSVVLLLSKNKHGCFKQVPGEFLHLEQ